MAQPATEATKGQARFLQVSDGKEKWTEHFWKTRVAQSAQLKLGQLVILPDLSHEGAYRAPRNRDEARGTGWFMAKITDTSDLFKGLVVVSGGYKVRADAMRVPEPGTGEPSASPASPR